MSCCASRGWLTLMTEKVSRVQKALDFLNRACEEFGVVDVEPEEDEHEYGGEG